MLGHLRPYVGGLKKILAWPYLKVGFSATSVGLFGILLAVLAAVLARFGQYDWAFWLALCAMSTDMADGTVARATGTESPEGNYADALSDRLREGILMLGLLPLAPNLIGIALLGTLLTSFAKARCALVVIMDNRDWPGFGDHSDRAVILLIAYFFAPKVVWPIALLVVATWSCFFWRTRSALSMIKAAETADLLPYLRASDEYQR